MLSLSYFKYVALLREISFRCIIYSMVSLSLSHSTIIDNFFKLMNSPQDINLHEISLLSLIDLEVTPLPLPLPRSPAAQLRVIILYAPKPESVRINRITDLRKYNYSHVYTD